MVEIFKIAGKNYLISYRKFPHYIFGHNIFTIFALISNQALDLYLSHGTWKETCIGESIPWS